MISRRKPECHRAKDCPNAGARDVDTVWFFSALADHENGRIRPVRAPTKGPFRL